MHRAAFLFFGIDGTYELFDVEEVEFNSRVETLIASGLAGFNATIPHKQATLQLCRTENQSLEARLVGAANTLRIDSAGVIHTHNTDLPGFMNALDIAERGVLDSGDFESSAEKIPKRNRAIVLGAGGAARACIIGLVLRGYEQVDVISRRIEQGRSVCADITENLQMELPGYKCLISAEDPQTYAAKTDLHNANLMVNCTPIGLTDAAIPGWIEDIFCRFAGAASAPTLFFDTVYKADLSATPLMCVAKQSAFVVCDGLSMLVEQAALAFQYWTGHLPPSALMLEAAKGSLAGNSAAH